MVTALVPAAGLDFLTGGALNKYTRAGAIRVVKAIGTLAIRGGVPVASSIAGSAARAALPIVYEPVFGGGRFGLWRTSNRSRTTTPGGSS